MYSETGSCVLVHTQPRSATWRPGAGGYPTRSKRYMKLS